MSGDIKKEFGDYQTPIDFCYEVAEYIKQQELANGVRAILEPTCGVGNFLRASVDVFGCNNAYGIETNEDYARASQEIIPSAKIIIDSIFNVNTKQICGENDVLIIGNPPWATNANLSYNLPEKINFKGLRGEPS